MFARPISALKRLFLRYLVWVMLGAVIALAGAYGSIRALHATSTDAFCAICHVHPHAEIAWKKSTHFKNKSGIVVHCVDCHLPPGGFAYLVEKTRLGVRDGYAYFFTDTKKIDWEAKKTVEKAVHFTFESGCLRCHQDLYSLNLPPKGVKAHEYYLKNPEKVRCISCHIAVGHWREKPAETLDVAEEGAARAPVYPPDSGTFEKYTETIPGTTVAFNMIPIPEGSFEMGSPKSEKTRRPDEEPVRTVKLKRFWMGEIEVSWREFFAFYSATSTGAKTVSETQAGSESESANPDAITGPTPPYGAPDQGWGRGLRPAITMSWRAAETYCRWLSKVTGRKYRLPTEAEWEYACRAGKKTPFWFEGDPAKFDRTSLKNRIFGMDDSPIRKYAWFRSNSGGKTQPPYTTPPNPWGLYNMTGNVKEFCSDLYAPDAYGKGGAENPAGPSSGTEHVVRGGSYASYATDLRSAARDRTYTDQWLSTDPQSPKSIWWYSDSKDVGFRVVREVTEEIK